MEPRGRILPIAFYARDTLTVARELLGCLLCRRTPEGHRLWGRIVETEAYIGESDPACHGAAGRTPRTRVLYGPPGRSYVYFTYGMHCLFNAVTEREGYPAAVLVRALHPLGGLEEMRRRRGGHRILTAGPARLCRALGIDLRDNDCSLLDPDLHIHRGRVAGAAVVRGPRVGIRKGTDRLWRFWVRDDPHVSRTRSGPRGRGEPQLDTPRSRG